MNNKMSVSISHETSNVTTLRMIKYSMETYRDSRNTIL